MLSRRKTRTVLETHESKQTLSELDTACAATLDELSVPSDAVAVDILTFYYKAKNEKIKVRMRWWQTAPYMNDEYHVFTDADNLYLANLGGKYAIPLSALQSIKAVKKHTHLIRWNKDEDYTDSRYAPYNIVHGNSRDVVCKQGYGILTFHCNGENWGIYVPAYDVPIFEKLTGLTATKKA